MCFPVVNVKRNWPADEESSIEMSVTEFPHRARNAVRPTVRRAPVYITGTGALLPGDPVDNDSIEDHIGVIDGCHSALGRRALRWNGIERRHYALDTNGHVLHSNASMSADAVRLALKAAGLEPDDLDCLAAATTQGDRLAPCHASTVHADLGGGALDPANFQSVCASPLLAARHTWMAVRGGQASRAAAVAGEFSSRWSRPSFHDAGAAIDATGRPEMPADFLRFTLSDGAGAVVMQDAPRADGLSPRVDWIDLMSLAGRFDHRNCFATPRDFSVLRSMIPAWIGAYLAKVDSGCIDPARTDHVLWHYAARSLGEEIVDQLEATDAMIPRDRWFTTLTERGNVGTASIWIMLDDLMKSGKAHAGDRILCIAPESRRAALGMMMLEVVAPGHGTRP